MTELPRARAFGLAVLAALCSLLVMPALAGASSPPKYLQEGRAAYEQQLQKGEIASAVFNLKIRSLRLTLKDGKHFRYSYPPNGSGALQSQLHAKGVSYKIKKKGHGSHKIRLRYIVGGILLIVIVVAGAVLLVVYRRRRSRD